MTERTQNEIITIHLNKYGEITPRVAIDDYQIMRLASRIHEIKKKGMKIETEIKTNPNTGKTYAKYRKVG